MGYEAVACFPDAVPSSIDVNESIAREPLHAPTVSTVETQQSRTDEEVLEDIEQGSREALAILFGRYGNAVLNTAYRILRDASEADDLRQDVFLYVFQKAAQFDRRKGTAGSWIIQVTYHRAIDRRRYLTRRRHEEIIDDCLPASEGIPSIDSIDGRALVERLRNELTPEQQMTLDLHFLDGYTFREIADKNGQSVGNIRHHYYRALERLRSGLFPEKRA